MPNWVTIKPPRKEDEERNGQSADGGMWKTIVPPTVEPEEEQPQGVFQRFTDYVKRTSVDTAQGKFLFPKATQEQMPDKKYEDLNIGQKYLGAMVAPFKAQADVAKGAFNLFTEGAKDYGIGMGRISALGTEAETKSMIIKHNTETIIRQQNLLKTVESDESKKRIQELIDEKKKQNREMVIKTDLTPEEKRQLAAATVELGIDIGTAGLSGVFQKSFKSGAGKIAEKAITKPLTDMTVLGGIYGVTGKARQEGDHSFMDYAKSAGMGAALGYGFGKLTEKIGGAFGKKISKDKFTKDQVLDVSARDQLKVMDNLLPRNKEGYIEQKALTGRIDDMAQKIKREFKVNVMDDMHKILDNVKVKTPEEFRAVAQKAVKDLKLPVGTESLVDEAMRVAVRGEKKSGTMKDIFKGGEKEVKLSEKVPSQETTKIEVKAEQPKKIDVDQVIKDSDFVDYKVRETETMPTVTGGEASGKARFNFETGRGEIQVGKNTSEITKAHEFAHVANYKLGENEDKFSNQLAKFNSGQTTEPPKAILDYAKKTGQNPTKLATDIAKEIREASRIGVKDSFRSAVSTSEEFSNAVANVVTGKATQTPKWSKFVESEVMRSRSGKNVSQASRGITEAKRFESVNKKVDMRARAEKYVDEKSGIKLREPTAKGNELSSFIRSKRRLLAKTENKVVIKRLTKAIKSAENEMFKLRRVKPKYREIPKSKLKLDESNGKFRLKDDFKKATGIEITDKQEKEIIKLNKKIFGDENVKITAQILSNRKALGSYQDRMIKIVKGQAKAKDTFYHEAVHKYLDIFTTKDEQVELLLAAQKRYKTDDFAEIEERLAEDFIKYAKDREGMVGKIKNLFDKVLDRFKQYSKHEVEINDFYSSILEKKKRPTSTKPIVPKNTPEKFVPRGKDKTVYNEKLNTSEGVMKLVDKLSESDKINRDIQKRGVVSWAETEKEAEALGINVAKIRSDTRGASQFAAKIEAIKQLRANTFSELNDFLSTIPRRPSEAQKLEIAKRVENAMFIDRSLKSMGTEHGRAINIMRKSVMPEEYEMYNEVVDKLLDIDPKKYSDVEYLKKVDQVIDKKDSLFTNILNFPRSIMATADLSAPLRQGIFMAARKPKQFAGAFKSMFKQAFSEKEYTKVMQEIQSRDSYKLMEDNGLALMDLGDKMSQREEAIMSNLPEHIPVFGKIARGSNRAYTGFLNKFRADVFDDLVKKADMLGASKNPEFHKSLASFVNAATGRGELGRFAKHAELLNGTFFSPRLIASRLNLLNPKYYYKLNPFVRKEALKSLFTFVGAGAGVLALAKMGGAEVGTDARSADFGKIKIGNTRFDTWGGFQQYAVLASRLISGEMVSSTTGKEFELGEGYKPTTRADILQRFFEYKTAPVASFALGMLKGKTAIGEDFKVSTEIADRMLPMMTQDVYELIRDKKDPIMAAPGIFGVGVQTYSDKIPMQTKDARGKKKIVWQQAPSLGETIINQFTGKQLSNVPKNQWQALYAKKQKEDIAKAELSNAKREVLRTGKPVRIQGKYIYLDEGVVKVK